MTSRLLATLSLVAALGCSSAALAAGSVEAGQAKSVTCMACHGMDGNSVNPEWPNLAGQHSAYIEKQLRHFKAGERQNVLMSPMAMVLSDEDVADLAAYFAAQKVQGGETDPSKLALGQRLYRGGDPDKGLIACAGCHGPSGRGNPLAVYPAVHGQHAVYTALQLRAYRSGERSTSPNQIMQNVASLLSDEEIDALASYLQGLR